MKKIIAIILTICCLFAVVSCGNNKKDKNTNDSNLEKFNDMFASSAPTKAHTVVTQTFNGNVTLESNFTLTTGTVDGKTATTLVSEVETLSDIESGKLTYKDKTVTTNWYYEGKGTSTDKGATWNADGKDFAPKAGTLAMDLEDDYISSIEYSSDGASEKIVLEVSAENSRNVLANFLASDDVFEYDTTITVIAAGERITSVVIEYIVYEHMAGTMEVPIDISDMYVTIEVNYSYDIQAVSMD